MTSIYFNTVINIVTALRTSPFIFILGDATLTLHYTLRSSNRYLHIVPMRIEAWSYLHIGSKLTEIKQNHYRNIKICY